MSNAQRYGDCEYTDRWFESVRPRPPVRSWQNSPPVDATLTFIGTQRIGLLVLVLLLFALGALLNWLLWMFGWGRYRGRVGTEAGTDSKIRFVLADFFVKIINDFRHLLALLIVVGFAIALVIAMWPGMMKQDVTLIKEGLEGVAAALGGLLGSVIGYYFGESAASKRLGADQPQQPPQPAEQDEASQNAGNIEAPPKPPSATQGESVK